jgi:hypothetical protein
MMFHIVSVPVDEEVLRYFILWREHASKSKDKIHQDSTRHVPSDKRLCLPS